MVLSVCNSVPQQWCGSVWIVPACPLPPARVWGPVERVRRKKRVGTIGTVPRGFIYDEQQIKRELQGIGRLFITNNR